MGHLADPSARWPGELLTRGDNSRDEAEQCGAEHDGNPELLKLERRSERVYSVAWSLSDPAGGELQRPGQVQAQAPFHAPRLTDGSHE